jgi:beta-lactamase class A
MKALKNQTLAIPFALLASLVLAFFAGYGSRGMIDEESSRGGEIRLEGYGLINPLLECETAKPSGTFRELRPFKDKVQHAVDAHLAGKEARSISVYFRDLKNGPWFGVNEAGRFTPSSMMKVPLMMVILKRAEQDPSLLQTKIRYDGRQDMSQYQSFRPKDGLRAGSWYTVDDLIFRMIAYSDNNATRLLAGGDGEARVAALLAELGIPYEAGQAEDFITVRHYTSFFRVLFNASYLNHEMSEKALGYLARSTFEEGIRGGLPEGVTVASKFGEHSRPAAGGDEYQLNELGIVYYPDHPYLLGISTKGPSPGSLPRVIRDISKVIYNEVDGQHRQHGEDLGQVVP